MKKNGIQEAAYLNMVVTNGLFIVGTRYVSNPKEDPLTLYHSAATHYAIENGVSHMTVFGDNDKAILVVSEKLSDDKVLDTGTCQSFCYRRSIPYRLRLRPINLDD